MFTRTTVFALTAAMLITSAGMADPPPAPQVGLWNQVSATPDSVLRNNCYNYSTNVRNGKFAQPGRAARAKFRIPVNMPVKGIYVAATKAEAQRFKGNANQLAAFGTAVRDAAQADGLTPRANLAAVPAGESVVALVVGYVPVGNPVRLANGNWAQVHVLDYHWYRLNADGSWSHKPGSGRATTRDNQGNAIVNPAGLINANETRTNYDLFVTYMSFRAGTVNPENIDEWLVQTPEGTIRIVGASTSGMRAGWSDNDRNVIRDLVSAYLSGMTPVPPPASGWDGRTDGFIIEAGPRSLTQNPAMWDRSDQVRIEIRANIVRVTRYTQAGELIVNHYADSNGLEAYFDEQAQTRIRLNPASGDECYADCDQSTGPGVLDIFDFLCFGNMFAAGNSYACDCDLSTGPGVCDIFDFLCFGNAFSQGCD